MWIKGSVLATAVVLALVGCSADADPKPLPPLPSVSPTQGMLPVPPEATRETAQGAAAFVRYYLALLNAAFASSDASAVKAVTDPGCGGCQNLIGAIEGPASPGERVEGGDYEVVFAESPPVEDGDVIVDLRYVIGEVRVFGGEGDLVRTIPAQAPADAQMRLVRRGSGWVVQGFRTV